MLPHRDDLSDRSNGGGILSRVGLCSMGMAWNSQWSALWTTEPFQMT